MAAAFAPTVARSLALQCRRTLCVAAGRPGVRLLSSTAGQAPRESDNPLLRLDPWAGFPAYADIQTAHVEPAMTELLADHRHGISALEEWVQARAREGASPSLSELVDRLEAVDARLYSAWGLVRHLGMVRASDELRAAEAACQVAVTEAVNSVTQSKAIYEAFLALAGAEPSPLSGAEARLVAKRVETARHHGVDLGAAQQGEMTAMQARLVQLGAEFQDNVLKSRAGYAVVLEEFDRVRSLPDSLRALLAHDAAVHLDRDPAGASGAEGPWKLGLSDPVVTGFLMGSDQRDLREQMHRAYRRTASDGAMDNLPLIRSILQTRHDMARLLGYPTFADLSLASKMADGVGEVETLLEALRVRSWGVAEAEIQELAAFASSRGHPGELAVWDIAYWAQQFKTERLSLDENVVKQYFPLPGVLEGLFELARSLFGVTVTRAAHQPQVWHPDVIYYEVADSAGGPPIASFYFDPFSRPAEKSGGAWMDDARTRSRHSLPVAYLVCNFSPPVSGEPACLTFSDVKTLFHEFGHGLQHMLTEQTRTDVSGINGVEWDAIEVPSQFMENFAYQPSTLKSIGRHVNTGEQIPDAMIEKIQGARTFMAGYSSLRQLYFATLDLKLHGDPPADPIAVQKAVSDAYLIVKPPADDHFLCSFRHIFGGGYAAGYYSYKYAEVMAADAFESFAEAGLDNPDALRRLGLQFRSTFLSLGGGTHPADVFKAFKGRGVKPEALLRQYGL